MTIPELPLPLQNLAREYQKKYLKGDDLLTAFYWENTPEGMHFWHTLNYSETIEEAREKMSLPDRTTLDRILDTPKVEQTSYIYPLFEHLSDEHNLTLTNTEMEEIVRIVLRLNETFTKTSCHGVDAEYPTEEGKYFCFDERNQMLVMEWVGEKESWNKVDYWLKN